MKLLKLLSFFFILGCTSHTKDLPILSYKINDSGERINYTVDYDGFTNQLNVAFKTANVQNKIFIANFFFTRCPSICPPMRTQLIGIAQSFETENNFILLSHTIDPENDSILVLKTYAEATGIPNSKWQFLRASVEHTKAQASQFMTNFKPNSEGTDFYHSSYVTLVDTNQLIRGFYNILVKEDVDRLKEDIKYLLK